MPRSSKINKALVKRDSSAFKALALAAEAGKRGDYRLAVKILGELICETDAPPEAWLMLGRSFHALKDYSRSLAAFNDYLRQKPKSAEGFFFVGRTYLVIGMPYKAVPFLRKALENSSRLPQDMGAKIKALLGMAYLRSKHSLAAVQMLKDAAETAPHDKRIYRAWLNSLFVRGVRLCRAEDYENGLGTLRFVLKKITEAGISEPPLLRLELGRAARMTGKLEEALAHYTVALGLTGNDRQVRWSLASVLMALGKTAEARTEIERIRSCDSDVPQLPWNSELVDLFMIHRLLETGEWRRAAESCRAWLKNRGERSMIRVLYAEALRNLRDYEGAHSHLRRALEENPRELEFWYTDILVSWERKDYKSLKKALRAVKSLGGDQNILKRFTILWEIHVSDDTKANITLLQNAIHSLGPEPEFMYALGEAYLKTGLLEEALSWFQKTITLKNSHEASWLGKIVALEALFAQEGAGDTAKKLGACYKAYLNKWPSNLSIRRDRALFLVKTLKYAEAVSELEKLLVREPSNFSLRRVLAYSYRKTGRYREAALFLKALLMKKPDDIELIIEYTGCLERAGAAAYALSVLEKAREYIDRSPASADISLALGILNFRRKRTEKAFDCLREAAALAVHDPRPYEWMAIIARKNGGPDSYYSKEAQKRKKSVN